MRKLLWMVCMGAFCASGAWAQGEAYRNPALSPAERADDLLGRLTLKEKVSLMVNSSPGVEHLGIKPYNWWSEALHGVARSGLATVYPITMGMASSFDEEAVKEVYATVSDEARAKYHEAHRHGRFGQMNEGLTFWTPNVNIFRDPRWGRGQETWGEDPWLTARMGVAVVEGLQGPRDAKYDKLHACAKHYAVHSGPESKRHYFNVEHLDPRDLWETYLPAFKALVQEADVKEVMCAYQRFEGEPCCGSNRLLAQILRNEWGYKYLVVSDCGAIGDFYHEGLHGTHPDAASASASAVANGTDLECGWGDYLQLEEAVARGLIAEERVDASLRRLLEARFALGEMDPDSIVPWSRIGIDTVDCATHRRLALEMARKSMVLLHNDGVLPLDKEAEGLVVMGPNAVDSVMQWGNYEGTPSHTCTVLDGIRERLGADVPYEKGCGLLDNEVSAAEVVGRVRDAGTVVFVGGISPALEGEEKNDVHRPGFAGGDRTSIELPQVQRDILRTLKEAGKKVIFVNCSGSAMALVPELESCDAILQAWYPGQAGGLAVADVLFGDYNPGGKLPVTFYKNTGQLPDFEDYSMKGRTYRYMTERPLFPFGYGLSYTTFKISQGRLDRTSVKAGQEVTFRVNVENTGERDGAEVVQVYVRKEGDAGGPLKSLRGFRRVELKAGESREVVVPLPAGAFEFFSPATNTMEVEPGEYEVLYGNSSDTPEENRLTVELL